MAHHGENAKGEVVVIRGPESETFDAASMRSMGWVKVKNPPASIRAVVERLSTEFGFLPERERDRLTAECLGLLNDALAAEALQNSTKRRALQDEYLRQVSGLQRENAEERSARFRREDDLEKELVAIQRECENERALSMQYLCRVEDLEKALAKAQKPAQVTVEIKRDFSKHSHSTPQSGVPTAPPRAPYASSLPPEIDGLCNGAHPARALRCTKLVAECGGTHSSSTPTPGVIERWMY